MEALYRRRWSLDIIVVLLLAPMLVMLAGVLVLLNPIFNPGPLFFRQTRVGQGEQCFQIWKFRTMIGPETPGHFATQSGWRAKPLGRFLRCYHLDEIPQLINILRGEMTVVGPRPEQKVVYPRLVQHIPGYHTRQAYKPGLTSPGQICMGYASSHQEHAARFDLDRDYFARATLTSDLCIFGATILYLIGIAPISFQNFGKMRRTAP